ncbi:exo-beta-N-acetylmuramidase NamZ family protein [Pontibacter actiniarum]|uniref:DUF1343 domain-containing protein n=1 Tax=Pontibacter actiniarum TaxID=323450 RepID=A0A1X9YPD3_9BACT|nr:DUF1343 domain-containing protein [Pontibacter actiniarum]ARS34748.1 hypothetical protein CA264_04435 [Pontibacter actiniarum]
MKKHRLLFLLLMLLCCGHTNFAAADTPRVTIGAERLFTPDYLHLIKGKRVGLVTNHTGLLPDGRHLADVLHRHPDVKLTLLFGPEHGIRGDADTHVANSTDASTGLPVVSLYGKTRKPTPAQLKEVDVLVFDIQDIGARFYTYIATMNHVLEAAAENNIPYVVLDRPNAIGGVYVDGPVGKQVGEPVTGPDQLPVAHGMTVGELALMFNGERAKQQLPQASLTVVPMQHYTRQQWYDQTGLPWVKPSPNMLTLTTAAVYPATCLLEGTNVSEARGTLHPFERIGAAWADGEKLARQLNSYNLKGVRFRPVRFTPDSIVDGVKIYPPKFLGQTCEGAEMVITDRNAFAPAKAGVYILHALQTLYPQQLEWREARMDRLWGTPLVRQQLQSGKKPAAIVKEWNRGLQAFQEVRQQYLLYK